MELKIFWTDFSQKELEKIFEYYKENVGLKVALRLINGILDKSLKLKKQPKIGQIEELLKNRKEKFRYLIFKNYKIIYWINENKKQVEIIDIFDVRQNPLKIKRTL